MDETLRHHNPNPILRANPLEWNKELEKRKHGGRASLLKAFMRMFGVQYMLLGIIEGTKVVQPLFLGQLIRFFTPNSTVSLRDAYLFAMGVSVCAVVLAVTHHPYFFSVQRIGMKLRVAACSLLYRKALRLSNTALGQTTTGQIVNLMSNDAAIFIHYLWVGPLQAIPVLIILWIELGPSTLAGFGVLLLLVPVQSWMGKLFSKLRHKTAVHTDERVKVMNEIISGMRVIKMYCWEKPFGDLVGKIRSMESARVKRCSYVRGLIVGPFFVSTKLIVFLTFLSYVLTGNLLTPEKVFVTISIYQAIRLSTTLFIPVCCPVCGRNSHFLFNEDDISARKIFILMSYIYIVQSMWMGWGMEAAEILIIAMVNITRCESIFAETQTFKLCKKLLK
ncbi:hypothetical protein KUTeg_011849 [Tegillarca granosa]|uniref:ABC transmembrane type-1 domain-containing protein n=1 Tax=Tegillarca granosa TaxID=220873 RepID=A0ABQ9EXU9_TEGGR|nr:hypothetical protein KUTeg_011849 [Tegillarca granosa]